METSIYYVILLVSVSLYAYLLLHNIGQGLLSRERAIYARFIAFMIASLAFSLTDFQLYSIEKQPNPMVGLFTNVTFLLTSICSVLFVDILNLSLKLGLERLPKMLWGATGVQVLLLPFGIINSNELETTYTAFTGTYYIKNAPTLLGTVFTLLYLLSYLWTSIRVFGGWKRYEADDKIFVMCLAIMPALIVVDVLVYYRVIDFMSTWNLTYMLVAVAVSFRLNAQIHQLANRLEKANYDLQDAYQQMVEQERMSTVGQIVRGIVHDLKNFFNNVQSMADLGVMRLQKDPAFNSLKYFENIGKSTRHAHEYLLELLEMTGSEGGAVDLQPIRPAEIIDEVVRLSGARFVHPPIEVANGIPRELTFNGDKRLLTQLFLNLTMNAMQALRSWQGEHKIEYIWQRDEEKTILVLRDTGPGMPEEVSQHLFEHSVSTRKGGTGIGLMLVKRALDKHEATVEVNSAQGQGTAFVMTFPSPPQMQPVQAAVAPGQQAKVA